MGISVLARLEILIRYHPGMGRQWIRWNHLSGASDAFSTAWVCVQARGLLRLSCADIDSSSPVYATSAANDAGTLPATTSLYNLVDHPIGIVPVTHVDKAKDQLDKAWEGSGDKGSPMLYNRLYEGKKPYYDAAAMHGIPVGIQIVGRHWEDEKVIKMMRVVDDALGVRGFGPGTWSSARPAKQE